MKSIEELVKNGKHFCILPWIHFHAWPDKKVMPCCVADSSLPVSEIKDGVDILDMMNSEEYKKLRLAMINDEYYEGCRRCYELEEYGTWTMRQSQNMVRGMDNIIAVEDTNEDGSIDEFKLKYMDIRFSNLCNMKCRSCGPACSNLWGEEKLKEMDGDKDQFEIAFRLKDVLVSNTDENDFMSKLRPYLSDVEECYFAGGEILITPEHYECLDYWIENGLQDQVHLNYTTNMSKLTYKDKNGTRDLFEYWNQFPNIEIWASIDDIGDRAEIIRKGTNWNKIENNLRMIKQKAPHIRLGFTPTISLWNVWHYDTLFEYLKEHELLDPTIQPRINILTQPTWASVKNLPDHIAARLIDKYEKFVKYHDCSSEKNGEHIRNTFLVLLTALKENTPNNIEIQEFFKQNKCMDESRNEYVLDIIPELKELYQWSQSQTES